MKIMKKIVFLIVPFALFILSIDGNAQILQKKQGANGKYGFIDEETKEWVIQPQYENVHDFSEGLVVVKSAENRKWGYIDRYNNAITPFKYSGEYGYDMGDFHEGLAWVCIDDTKQHGYIDKTGKEIIPLIYDIAHDFSEGLACVGIDLEWYDGNFEKAENGGPFEKAKHGFINKSGEIVIPCKFGFAYSFSEGLAAVAMNEDVFYTPGINPVNGIWGFINKQGQFIIKPQYAHIFNFHDGLAPVQKTDQGTYGYIDKKNNVVIPFQYSHAYRFQEGVAIVDMSDGVRLIDKTGKVIISGDIDIREVEDGIVQASKRQNGKSLLGAYDTKGNIIVPFEEYPNFWLDNSFQQRIYAAKIKHRSFSSYAKKYVESVINDWQRKGRYEKTTDWQARVTEQTRNAKIKELTAIAEKKYTEERAKTLSTNFNIVDYDADNEIYLIRSNEFGNILVPVPLSSAESFQNSWKSITKTPKYFINNDKLALSECAFKMPNGQTFKYSNQASLNYTSAQVDYNFDPIEIKTTPANGQGKQNITSKNVSVGKADVDINIPETTTNNTQTFAVIIANENYKKEGGVDFALNDGKLFRDYCEKTLGIPVNQIHLVEDATLNDIRGEIEWLKKVADAYKEKANIVFYYNGHGIPDYTSKAAYLLPVDGYGSDATTGYRLSTLYAQLGALQVKSITVFLDACFSGAQKDGKMLVSLRGKGVIIKIDENKPSGNTVVFAASANDEIAYPYLQKGHGLFTYFLLKKLQESKGNVTLGELGDYIATNVKQQSIVVNSKSQTPTVIPSATLGETWQNKKLK
jgi:hypothetical protein